MPSEIKYVCVSIPENQQRDFDDALSDVICWLDGYQAAGGNYSPGSLDRLRIIRTTILKAYHTIPPSTEAMTQAEPEWPKYFMGIDSDVVMQADSPEDLGTFHCSDGRTWKSTCNPPAVRHAKGEGRKQLTKAEAEKIVGRKL